MPFPQARREAIHSACGKKLAQRDMAKLTTTQDH
jgi:hypothetical protein